MLKTSVLKIIQSFSKEEISEFNDFLKSPYHNKKSGVVKLFNEIKKYYPDFKNENLENEKLWSKLYPGKKYGYGVMKNLIFDITKLAEEFMAQQEFRKNEIQEFYNLYCALTRRNIKKILDSKNSMITRKFNDEILKKNPESNNVSEYYFYLSGIYKMRMTGSQFYDQRKNMEKDIIELQDLVVTGLLIRLIDMNDMFKTLSYNDKGNSCSEYITDSIIKMLSEGPIEKILKDVRKRSEVKYNLLKCYFLGYRAASNLDDAEYFYKFKLFFLKNFKSLPVNFLCQTIVYISNTIALITDSSLDKPKEQYEFYKFLHKNNLFLGIQEQLNSSMYVRYLFLFLDNNTLIELEEYADHYKKYIIVEDREDAFLFTEAMILYMKSDFVLSLELVQRINFEIFSLKNFIKRLTCMLYYELNYYEEFKLTYDSVKHFLSYGDLDKQNPSIKYIIKMNKDFYGNLNKLFKLREDPDLYKISYFENIIHENNVILKNWFLRKINELKKMQTKLSA